MMNHLPQFVRNGLPRLARYYHVTYRKNLLATNLVVSSGCCCIGDIVVQKFVEKQEKLNLRRLAAMTSWGVFYGFVGHVWYSAMARSKVFTTPHKQSLLYLVLLCPLEDVFFYTYTGFFEGQNREEIKTEVRAKLLPTLLIDACVYYPVMYCNIRFVPFRLRVSVDSAVGLFYAVLMSYLKHHDIDVPLLNLN